MKKLLAASAALVALPFMAHAQSLQPGGFYVGVEGGLNWMMSASSNDTFTVARRTINTTTQVSPNLGWAAGGMIGYDFIGPRLEVEGVYRENGATLSDSSVTPLTGSLNFRQT